MVGETEPVGAVPALARLVGGESLQGESALFGWKQQSLVDLLPRNVVIPILFCGGICLLNRPSV